MNVVAPIPVNGRHPLLKQTIGRLIKNGITVVCVGEHSDKDVCESSGAIFEVFKNNPLGSKWNAAFKKAMTLNPDACLFVGSSDWVSDNWVELCLKEIDDHDMVGTLGCHLLDIHTHRGKRLVYWPGYGRGERAKEPIGIGRVISARILNKFNWEPFDPHKDNSMDWQMWQKVLKNGGKVKILESDCIKSLSISTNLWSNKHRFEEHWSGPLKSSKMEPNVFLETWFPESINLFSRGT